MLDGEEDLQAMIVCPSMHDLKAQGLPKTANAVAS
jgi:hypothetical protein